MKKVNKKGFTLIELIIVSTIMVMVMGAILNFIRPMNRLYERTQNMDDTNDIGSILMDYVDNELRFATNVVVLQDYQGVPALVNQMLVDNSGNPSFSAKFTNALIIDNEAVRGSQLAGYDPQGTVAHRKRAPGCILRANVINTGIDVDKLRCLGEEPLYNDYGFTFDVSMNVENKCKFLSIDMALSRPELRGLNYVFDKPGFNQTRDFELVNINLDKERPDDQPGRNMNAEFYSAKNSTLDYNKFVQASHTGTLTGTYTYILYTRDVPKTEKVKIRLINNNTKQIMDTKEWISTSPLTETFVNNWKQLAEDNVPHNGHIYTGSDGNNYKSTFLGIMTKNNESIDYFLSAGIITDMEFFCNYTDQKLDTPKNFVHFRDRFDDGREDTGDYKYVRDIGYYPVGSSEGADGKVYFDYPGNGDNYGEYVFVGWNLKKDLDPSTVPPPTKDASDKAYDWYVPGEQYSGDPTYYAIYEQKDTVAFNVAGFSSTTSIKIVDGYTSDDYKNDSRFQQLIQEAKDNAPAGQVFENLHVFDAADEDLGVFGSDPNIFEKYSKGGFTIKPIYKDCAYEGTYEVTITIEDINPYYNKLEIQGSPAHFVLCEEDGTTEIVSETSEYYKQIANVFSPGKVLKLYIYDNASVSVSFNDSSVTVNDNCACVYDGTSLRVN